MQLNFNEKQLQDMVNAPALQPFHPTVLSFLNDLSLTLMKAGRQYSDVVTFAFWCRRAALLSYKENYHDLEKRLGRGVAFHIAPSNVPVNFAFSLVSGLLAGNKNIVRVPSKEFGQVTIIADAIGQLIADKYPEMANYICLLKYDRTDKLTTTLSACCDVRIIWGGDATIAEIRKSPLPPRATEITFADRHSFCVIDSDAYMAAENKENLTRDFYNDTYFLDQNACTSPRIVIWTGEKIAEAKEWFWNSLETYLADKYTIEPVQVVGKLSALYKVAAAQNVKLVTKQENVKLMRIQVKQLTEQLMDYKYNSGFFFEYDTHDLSDILPLCDTKCQTISCIGNLKEDLKQMVISAGTRGVDRIVPVGRTMDFSLEWDGYELISHMTRIIG